MECIRFKWRVYENILKILRITNEYEWSLFNTQTYEIYAEMIGIYGIFCIYREVMD